MSAQEVSPMPKSAQTLEERGFERMYYRNPDFQARFAANLLGFRELLKRENNSEADEAIVAVEGVLKAFHDKYPEFMFPEFTGDNGLASHPYRADPVVIGRMNEVLCSRERD